MLVWCGGGYYTRCGRERERERESRVGGWLPLAADFLTHSLPIVRGLGFISLRPHSSSTLPPQVTRLGTQSKDALGNSDSLSLSLSLPPSLFFGRCLACNVLSRLLRRRDSRRPSSGAFLGAARDGAGGGSVGGDDAKVAVGLRLLGFIAGLFRISGSGWPSRGEGAAHSDPVR
jgi:hypothetical protein